MTEPKCHHFVPQFLIRQFTADNDKKSVRLVHVDSGRLHHRASVRKQAQRRNLYVHPEIERLFSFQESGFASLVHLLNDDPASFGRAILDENLHISIVRFLLLQNGRNPDSGVASSKAQCDFTRWAFLHYLEASNPEMYERLSEAGEDSLQFTVDYRASVLESIVACVDSHFLWFDLVPLLLLNRTKIPFVLGDQPLILANPMLHVHRGSRGIVGLSTRGLAVTMPITPNLQLLLYDGTAYRTELTRNHIAVLRDSHDVQNLNSLQFASSVDVVFVGSSRSSDWAEHLRLRQESGRHQRIVSRDVVLPTSNNTARHTFDRPLNLPLDLSFLRQRRQAVSEDIYAPRSGVLKDLKAVHDRAMEGRERRPLWLSREVLDAWSRFSSHRAGQGSYDGLFEDVAELQHAVECKDGRRLY